MMLRRAFLRRMAGAVIGVGLLGTELLARGEGYWLVLTVGCTYTFEIYRGDEVMECYQGAMITDVNYDLRQITVSVPGGIEGQLTGVDRDVLEGIING